MEKLKGRFDFDLRRDYTYYSIYSNALFLNKKLYLLYNFWNQRKEFFLLKDQGKKSRIQINFQGFFSLGFCFNIENKIKFDYFNKWSSSFVNISDISLKILFDNRNKKKYLAEPIILTDYFICDNVFLDYNINEKKRFFYFYKAKLFLNFFFKLSKKDTLQFKYLIYIYLFNYYRLLNHNFNLVYFINNWKEKFNILFFYKLKLCIQLYIKKRIKKNIFLFFFIKKIKKYFLKRNFIFKYNKSILYFFKHFLSNKIIKNSKEFYLKNFFQYKFFIKKFNERFNKRFNKLFFNCRISKDKRKERGLWLFKKKFLSLLGTNMAKDLKRKKIFFLRKFNGKSIVFRNFYLLNYWNKKKHLSNDKKKEYLNLKKNGGYRILKKLRTFYYIPNTKRTRWQVYWRFRKSVIYKFKKKKKRRIQSFYSGLKFNLFTFNFRTRYGIRKRELHLKKKSTPLYFYFSKKKNKYIKFKNGIMKVFYNKLPYYMIKKNNLSWRVKEPFHFYYKERDYKLLRCFDHIRRKEPVIKLYKKYWMLLYRCRNKKYINYKFNRYMSTFRNAWKNLFRKKKKRKRQYFDFYLKRLNSNMSTFEKKKKTLWFYQKIILYWKSIFKLKSVNRRSYFDFNNLIFENLRFVYSKFFKLNIQLLKFFNIYVLRKSKRKKKLLYSFFSNIIYFFKYYLFIYLYFIKILNKLRFLKIKNVSYKEKKKKCNINIKTFDFFKWRMKKKQLKILKMFNKNRYLKKFDGKLQYWFNKDFGIRNKRRDWVWFKPRFFDKYKYNLKNKNKKNKYKNNFWKRKYNNEIK